MNGHASEAPTEAIVPPQPEAAEPEPITVCETLPARHIVCIVPPGAPQLAWEEERRLLRDAVPQVDWQTDVHGEAAARLDGAAAILLAPDVPESAAPTAWSPSAPVAAAWMIPARWRSPSWMVAPAESDGALDLVAPSLPWGWRRRSRALRRMERGDDLAILPLAQAPLLEAMRALYALTGGGLTVEEALVIVPPGHPGGAIAAAWERHARGAIGELQRSAQVTDAWRHLDVEAEARDALIHSLAAGNAAPRRMLIPAIDAPSVAAAAAGGQREPLGSVVALRTGKQPVVRVPRIAGRGVPMPWCDAALAALCALGEAAQASALQRTLDVRRLGSPGTPR